MGKKNNNAPAINLAGANVKRLAFWWRITQMKEIESNKHAYIGDFAHQSGADTRVYEADAM